MAEGIQTKVGLMGDKDFKAGLREIGKQLTQVKTGMDASTAAFDKSDKSMAALKARGDGLKGMYDVQAQKVQYIAQQLAAAKDEYGENSNKAQELQIALNRATAAMNRTGNEIAKNEAELAKLAEASGEAAEGQEGLGDAAGDAAGAVQESGDAAGESEKKHSKLAQGLKAVATVAGGALVAGAKAAAAAMAALTAAAAAGVAKGFDLAKGAGTYADDLLTMSTVTGVAAGELQEWSYAARFIDTDVDVITKSMGRMTKGMGDAAGGSKTAQESFKKLGVSYQDGSGQLRSAQDVFADAIDALGKMTNETERDALAMELFGKSARELNPLIEAGGGALKKYGQEARDMGVVFSGAALETMGSFDDAMQRVDATGKGLKNAIGLTLIPAFQPILDTASGTMAGVTKALADGLQPGEITQIMGMIAKGLDSAVKDAVSLIEKALPFVVEAISALLTSLASQLPGLIMTLLPKVMEMMQALLDALAGNIGPLAKAIAEMVKAVATFLIQNLPVVLQAMGQIVLAILDALTGIDFGAALAGLWDGLVAVFGAVGEWLIGVFGGAWEGIKGAFVGVGDWAKGVWQAIVDAFKAVITWFGDLFTGAWKAIGDAFSTAGEWAATVWQAIVDGFVAAVTWFGELFTGAWKAIGDAFATAGEWAGQVWDAIKAGFAAVADWYKGIFEDAWGFIKGAFATAATWAGEVWSAIKGGFVAVADWYKGIFEDAWKALTGVFATAGEWAAGVWSAIKNAFASVGEWFAKTFGDGWQTVKQLFDTADRAKSSGGNEYGGRGGKFGEELTLDKDAVDAFNAAVANLEKAPEISAWYKAEFAALKATVDTGVKEVTAALAGLQKNAAEQLHASKAIQVMDGYMKGMVLSMAQNAPVIRQAMAGMLAGVVAAMGEALSRFVGLGEQISAGVAAGIRKGSEEIRQAAIKAAQAAYDAARRALDIRSPSRKMAEIGLMYDAGLAQGITRGMGSVVSAARGLSDRAAGAIRPAGGAGGIDYDRLGEAVARANRRAGIGDSQLVVDGRVLGETIEPSVSRANWQRAEASWAGRTARLATL